MTKLDEDWLAAALGDLGAAIDVPSDGPDRVLAARGPASPPRLLSRRAGTEHGAGEPGVGRRVAAHGRRAKGVVAVALASVAVLLLSLALIHPSTRSTTSTSETLPLPASGAATGAGSTAKSAGAQDAVGQFSNGSNVAPANSAIPAPAPAAAPAQSAAQAPAVTTKIIKTGSVDLQVGKGRLSATVDQLTSLAGGMGGYVSDAKTIEGGGAPSGDITLRVPVDQFESLLSHTRALGKPTAVSTSGQDVTAAYVDLEARIQALQDTRTQYLQILSKATAIGDILAVEQQLSALQTQIEQLQGQQKVLADQTSFATLAVHLSEPGAAAASLPAAPGGLSKAWDHARHTFAHGVEAVIGASGGVLVFALCLGLLLLAARLSWPVIRRRLV